MSPSRDCTQARTVSPNSFGWCEMLMNPLVVRPAARQPDIESFIEMWGKSRMFIRYLGPI